MDHFFNCAWFLWTILLVGKFIFGTGSSEFDDVCNKIWREDKNRLKLGFDFHLNIQQRISDPSSNTDQAHSPLFNYVNRNIFNKPTFKTFLALLDNYERFVGTTEDMTSAEKKETWEFLQEISQTGPIKELHKYLAKKGMASASMDDFLQELYEMWFYRYRRASYRDSSGFEHVFVGEISRGAVSGFHNWLQFYQLEKGDQLDYYGYLTYYKTEPSVLKLQFYWDKYQKFITSLFLGTSPEFEMAAYTLCFLVHPGKSCRCRMNRQDVPITTYTYGNTDYYLMIGTAYVRI